MKLAIAAFVASLATTTLGLGINCDGSSVCHAFIAQHPLQALHSQVSAISAGTNYGAGQHIACAGHICAFYQNTGGNAGEAANLIEGIINHGCTVCGSNPTQPGNNVATGELTVNYVENL